MPVRAMQVTDVLSDALTTRRLLLEKKGRQMSRTTNGVWPAQLSGKKQFHIHRRPTQKN